MDFKQKVLEFFTHLTWPKFALYAVTAAFSISTFTIWENRQNLFTKIEMSFNNAVDDYKLHYPSKDGVGIISEFMRNNPEVLMLSIVDANPIDNDRIVVYRHYNDKRFAQYAGQARPVEVYMAGNPPLFTSDVENNKLILAMLRGEFYCIPSTQDQLLQRRYPSVALASPFQCRVPIPPSFGKATGWFELQLSDPLDQSQDRLKVESLVMSLRYFETEVMRIDPSHRSNVYPALNQAFQ